MPPSGQKKKRQPSGLGLGRWRREQDSQHSKPESGCFASGEPVRGRGLLRELTFSPWSCFPYPDLQVLLTHYWEWSPSLNPSVLDSESRINRNPINKEERMERIKARGLLF